MYANFDCARTCGSPFASPQLPVLITIRARNLVAGILGRGSGDTTDVVYAAPGRRNVPSRSVVADNVRQIVRCECCPRANLAQSCVDNGYHQGGSAL